MLAAARHILEQEGIDGLTLRAAARAASVSHAAPKNHFGDLTGLLSELAAEGFTEFSEALLQDTEASNDSPQSRLNAMGRAYVGYARAHPGMFLLMFRSARLDMERPALRMAYQKARSALAGPIAARRGIAVTPTQVASTPDQGIAEEPALEPGQAVAMVGAWSLVHGFSMLLIDSRLDPILRRMPSEDDWQMLLDAVFSSLLSKSKG